MKYVVKHNIPNVSSKKISKYDSKGEALFSFVQIKLKCMGLGYPIKCFVRDDVNKPLRAPLKAEVDNFTYYAELYAQ